MLQNDMQSPVGFCVKLFFALIVVFLLGHEVDEICHSTDILPCLAAVQPCS